MKDATLVVTDLDGTFVYDSKSVRTQDHCAIKKVQVGAKTAFATGRSVKEMQYIEQKIGIHVDYYIAFNGAFVQDKVGKILLDKPMTGDTIEILTRLFSQYNIVFDALDGEARWGNFQHEQADTLWGMEFITLNAPYDMLHEKNIYKINIRPQKNDIPYIVDLLRKEVPEVHVYQTGSSRLEVVRKDVSKALGIIACVNSKQQIVAIGDGVNDIEMFGVADMSYCIAGAPLKVQAQAKKTVPYFSDAISDFETICNRIGKKSAVFC